MNAPILLATPHAEFLYDCVEETITRDLPGEIEYLEQYDESSRRVQEAIADMPGRTIDLLSGFLRENHGTLSKRARTREFERLTAAEVEMVKALYTSCSSSEFAREANHRT